MGKQQIHVVPTQVTTQRLQEYGVDLFTSIPTKSALKKALRKNQIRVDGEIATTATMIRGGETISFSPGTIKKVDSTFDLNLRILYEDNHLAAIFKPAGVLVSGNSYRTIANALPQTLKQSEQDDPVSPQPVHRLDYATTGILLVGKTAESIRRLNKLFEEKQIRKTYYAVTVGVMEMGGTIDKSIADKVAITDYTVEAVVDSERFNKLNLVKLLPKTGRRHQLRIHLSGIGNPILGDRDYSPESLLLKGKGMYLHAYSLEFLHPFTREKLLLSAPIPKRFTKIFGTL